MPRRSRTSRRRRCRWTTPATSSTPSGGSSPRSTGTRAYLINDIRDVRREWLEGAKRIGVTAGASAPEVLVTEVVEALRNGGATVREVKVGEENVRFALPPELEQMARERGTTLPSRP